MLLIRAVLLSSLREWLLLVAVPGPLKTGGRADVPLCVSCKLKVTLVVDN